MADYLSPQDLANAKIDAKTLGEALNDEKVVKPRYGKSYDSFPLLVRKLLDNGGFRPFPNEQAIKDYVPTVTPSVAKDMSTYKLWLWDKGVWTDTGLSELDRAKDCINSSIIQVAKETSSGEFHNNDNDAATSTPILVSGDKILVSLNHKGEVMNAEKDPILFEFYGDNENLNLEFYETDENGFIVNAENSDSGIDVGGLQFNEKNLNKNDLYLNNRKIVAALDYSGDLFNADQSSWIFETPTSIYKYLDAILSKNPDYMSKEDLGYDEWGNVISQYTLTCPKFIREEGYDWSLEQTKAPKILLMSGTHGGAEKAAVISTIILIHNIIENWKQDSRLSNLRWSTDLVIVPLLNPSGYILGTRENRNGVDLNRDAVALTQNETKIAVSLTEKHSDIEVFIDSHNSFAFGTHQRPFWVGFTKKKLLTSMCELGRINSEYIRREFDLYDLKNESTVKVGKLGETMIANVWSKTKTGVLLETPRSGGLGVISLKNRRIHNYNCILNSLIALRSYLVETEINNDQV